MRNGRRKEERVQIEKQPPSQTYYGPISDAKLLLNITRPRFFQLLFELGLIESIDSHTGRTASGARLRVNDCIEPTWVAIDAKLARFRWTSYDEQRSMYIPVDVSYEQPIPQPGMTVKRTTEWDTYRTALTLVTECNVTWRA